MNNIEEIAAFLATTWGGKTLSEFRAEAKREANGTVYESIRIPGGQRLALIMCITAPDQIALVERAFEFVDDGILEDWNTFTLGEVFKRTVVGVGFSFESLRDELDRRSALMICSTEPRSMEIMGTLFDLPK